MRLNPFTAFTLTNMMGPHIPEDMNWTETTKEIAGDVRAETKPDMPPAGATREGLSAERDLQYADAGMNAGSGVLDTASGNKPGAIKDGIDTGTSTWGGIQSNRQKHMLPKK